LARIGVADYTDLPRPGSYEVTRWLPYAVRLPYGV